MTSHFKKNPDFNVVTGFLHSPIHLGYAIEFCQPLVAAEALALTAIHDAEFGETLAMAEAVAKQSPESKGLVELQEIIYANSKLRNAMKYENGIFQIRDGLLENAKVDFLHILGSWKVNPDNLNEKTAESLNSTSKFCDISRNLFLGVNST